MANIVDVIKYEGDNSTFIWKHPSEDFNTMSQLIVHESQEAVFFLNGQALDLFGPGRHTLTTQNIPLVGKLLNKVTGDTSPFHCEVYFINKTVQMGIMWGTDSKVNFLDPTLGVPFAIGAHGHLNLQVTDSRKLLVKLVGTMNGIAWEERGQGFTKSLGASFKPMISTAVKAHLASSIKEKKINLLEIDENLEVLSEALRENITSNFEEYGLSVPQFYIKEISLPEDDPNFKKLREIHSLEIAKKAEQALRERKLEEETTETELEKRRLERELLNAQLEAQKTKLQGFAEAEVMQAQGYNQKDVLQAEVQKAYAEGIGNMGANGGGGGGGLVGDMVGLGIGMAAAGTMTSQMGNMFAGIGGTPQNNNVQAQTTEAPNEKIVCPSCGKEVPAGAKFCFECGQKIEILKEDEVICPKCGKKVHKGKFCLECGASLVLTCPKCGKEVPSGAKFCLECGEKLQ